MGVEKTEELKTQLYTYLKSTDIINDDLLSFMTDLTMWPQNSNLLNIIVLIRSNLTQIVTFTESVLARGLYLSDGVSYRQILIFHYDFRRQKSED